MEYHPPAPKRHNTNMSASSSAQWHEGGQDFNKASSSTNFNRGYGDGPTSPVPYQDAAADAYTSAPVRRPGADRAQSTASKFGPGRASFVPPKSTGDLRMWRHDERGNMWTKGSRGRCFGRFCCCTLLMTMFFIFSIVFALGMWVRPPDIVFNGVQVPTEGGAVSVQQDGLHIDLKLSIGVKNPNFFAAAFSSIDAKAFYPPLVPQLGGGTLENIVFPANSDTTFLFPFNIKYTTTIDPDKILTSDLVEKCGIKPGSTKRPLTVKYDLTLKIKILVVTISPSFSGTADFDCPVTRSDLEALGGEALLGALGV